jgi:chromosome segregation ATPase
MQKIMHMVNQNVQDALKKFQDTKNKEHEKMQKQINELRKDFNKHQIETKDTLKKEIYELKMTTKNMKEELNEDMENLRRKNQTEILEIKNPFGQTKNKAESHTITLEQMENRILQLKDKIEIKEKNRRTLSQTTQEL